MAKFVEFTSAQTNAPIVVNLDHVHTAEAVAGQERGQEWVRLVMSGGGDQMYAVNVEGTLKSVLEELTGEREIRFRKPGE
jgi:hypothetical protein